MKQPPPQQHPEPPRAIGAAGLGAAVFNMVVGAGIFVLPAALAREVGAAAPFAYLACVVTVGAVVICFAAASSRVAASGGPYAFVHAALGPGAGFLAGVLVWLGSVLAAAGIGAALIDALKEFFPVLDGALPRAAGTDRPLCGPRGGEPEGRRERISALRRAHPRQAGADRGSAGRRRLPCPGAQLQPRGARSQGLRPRGAAGDLRLSGDGRRARRQRRGAAAGAQRPAWTSRRDGRDRLPVPGHPGGGSRGPRPGPRAFIVSPHRRHARRRADLGAADRGRGGGLDARLSIRRHPERAARDLRLSPGTASCREVLAASWGRRERRPRPSSCTWWWRRCSAITGAFVQLAVLSTLAIACVYLVGCVSAVILQRRGIALAGPPLTLRGLEVAATVGVVGVAWIASHATRTGGAGRRDRACGEPGLVPPRPSPSARHGRARCLIDIGADATPSSWAQTR